MLKECLTVSLCCNANGSEKLTPVIICRDKKNLVVLKALKLVLHNIKLIENPR